jgi:hypothetical protein
LRAAGVCCRLGIRRDVRIARVGVRRGIGAGLVFATGGSVAVVGSVDGGVEVVHVGVLLVVGIGVVAGLARRVVDLAVAFRAFDGRCVRLGVR